MKANDLDLVRDVWDCVRLRSRERDRGKGGQGGREREIEVETREGTSVKTNGLLS